MGIGWLPLGTFRECLTESPRRRSAALLRKIGDDTPMDIEPLMRMLGRRDVLSEFECELLAGLKRRTSRFSKGDELVRSHSRPSESCLVLEGFTAREIFMTDGQRQITAVHIPGDFVDLHALTLKTMDHSVVALTESEATFVPHAELLRIIASSPHLGRLFWLSTVIDAAIQRAWIAGIGRRSASAQLSHLLCELYRRLEAVGLAIDYSFRFPITQAELADILGMSLVHVNRTLQYLRRRGLVIWKNGTVTLPDLHQLALAADFDPTYLNLVNEPR